MNKFVAFFKGIGAKIAGMTKMQAIIAATTGVVAVAGIGTGTYFAVNANHTDDSMVGEIIVSTEDWASTESLDTEDLWAFVSEETEEELAEADKELTLSYTSLDKDLKVKVNDQQNNLVEGTKFEISVKGTSKGSKAKEYTDDDKDGIIYIKSIDGGEYNVELTDAGDYKIAKGSIKATVKGKLEMKKVDVEDEIKKESEIDKSAEDTATNNVEVEATLTDTVALVDSTATPSKTIARSELSTSNFPKSSAGSGTDSTGAVGYTETVTTTTTETQSTETKTTETQTTETQSTETKTTETETTVPETTTPTSGGSTETQTTETQTTGSVSAKNRTLCGTSTTKTSTVEHTVTVTMPSTVQLYNVDAAASNSYTITLSISGDSSVIKKIEWATTNASYISVTPSSDGKSCTVKRAIDNLTTTINVGAVITYQSKEDGTTSSKKIECAVNCKNMTGSDNLLDGSGSVVYTDQNGKNKATLSDYSKYTQFYGGVKYTGWQTINGKVYYYNSDGTAVTGSQVIGGVQYNFASDGSLQQSSGTRGIDVSSHQGTIDWGAVASSGISFAIIRCGYRGASSGALVQDSCFTRNIQGATRAGIKVGVYFFTQAVSPAEAVEEASMALTLCSGYSLSLPIFVDSENASGGRANGLDSGTRTSCLQAFCQTCANSGRSAGVYASKNWFNTKVNASALSNYSIWVAQYNTSCTYGGKKNYWQYTSSGTVSGISGRVDMDIMYQ